MNDAFVVRRCESLGDLGAVLHRAPQRQSAAGQLLPQGVAFETFRNKIWRALMLANIVDGKNVGVVQRGDGARFGLEPPQPLWVPRERPGQNLDGHVAPKPGIPRPVHFSHAASAQRSKGFIWTEFGTRGECHVCA